ncbi:MAG: hypothetical protein ABFS56_04490 [Pseudomonadota bacterium]
MLSTTKQTIFPCCYGATLTCKLVPWHLTPHNVGEWAEQPLTLFLENADDWELFEGKINEYAINTRRWNTPNDKAQD